MNKLSTEARSQILHCLCEGNSLRATSRLTGTSINTVTKLLVDAGNACFGYQDRVLRDLSCKKLQCDEIWSFCYAKEKNCTSAMRKQGAGDIWTWAAIDSETKLVPCWFVGRRDASAAYHFMHDLASRLIYRVQLTTDGHQPYITAVEDAFGADIDYAQLVKIYGSPLSSSYPDTRYSPAQCTGSRKVTVVGTPDKKDVSTSLVERQNLTMRMSIRRFTRLTNGFSKKVENHEHAVALHFMYYNFCRIHKSLRVTPAMEAGVTDHVWDLKEVVQEIDKNENSK